MNNRQNIVVGQRVSESKRELSKELRRQMTTAEQTLWRIVRRNQLMGMHFRRQQVIDGFIADFYCHEAQLVIEVDGSAHLGREEYDSARDEIITARGLHLLRFTNEQVLDRTDDVVSIIHQFLSDNLVKGREDSPFPRREGG